MPEQLWETSWQVNSRYDLMISSVLRKPEGCSSSCKANCMCHKKINQPNHASITKAIRGYSLSIHAHLLLYVSSEGNVVERF